MSTQQMVLRDPKTGEEVEVTVPAGVTEAQVRAKLGWAEPSTLDKVRNLAGSAVGGVKKFLEGPAARAVEPVRSGVASAIQGTAALPYQGVAGLALAGAGALDSAGFTGARDKLESALSKFESGAMDALPGGVPQAAANLNRTADQAFPDATSRYVKAGTAGAIGGMTGPASALKAGAAIGGSGGLLAQAATESGQGPWAVLAASLLPSFGAAGYKALRDPIAVKQIKDAMAATSPEQMARAQQLIADAKARGVDLSPAQAFGPDHPLVSILGSVGQSTGGSAKVKQFLAAQTEPTNQLTEQVSNAFGPTDAATAANKVATRAATIRQAQESRPKALAGPKYEQGMRETLQAGQVDELRQTLEGLRSQFQLGPQNLGSKVIDDALALLQKGTKNVEDVQLVMDPNGMMKLVRGTREVPIDIETFGELKNARDEVKNLRAGIQMAGGKRDAAEHVRDAVSGAFYESSKQSPSIELADAIYTSAMRTVKQQRKGPLTALAGKEGRGQDQAENFSNFVNFLDPSRNSPRRIDATLAQLTDKDGGTVQAAASGYLRNQTEKARAGGGFAPADLELRLRGGEGSGKAEVLNALLKRAIDEQNLANPAAPINAAQYAGNINQNLDVMAAAGLGRNALRNVENMPRVAAQIDTPALLARAASPNLTSQTPTLLRFGETAANRKLAEALTDPTMQKLAQLRDYDRQLIVASLLRQGLQSSLMPTAAIPPQE